MKISEKVKWWLMIGFLLASVYLFYYCNYICINFNQRLFDATIPFFHILYRYALGFFPYLIAACFVGGFLMTYYNTSRFKMRDSMPGAMLFATLLPICSCGAIPIGRAMLETGQIRVRTIIAFMMVAPMLSPIIIPLSLQLGVEFTVARIAGAFLLAAITGIAVEKLTGVKEEGKKGKAYSCVGCSKSRAIKTEATKSPVIASWNLLVNLTPPISQGIIIGALVAKYVPPALIAPYLTSDVLGIFVAGLISFPLYICHGQEVLILKPLMSASMMGAAVLPVGHALVFAFTGTGMCLAAVPPLIATIGKKATIVELLFFYFGSIAMGLALNFVLSMI